MTHARLRFFLGAIWLLVVTGAVYAFAFHRAAIQAELQNAASVSMLVCGLAYLVLGCVRGLTLIPSTSLVVLALPFFPPVPLFVLTLIGIVVSSAGIYFFAESLHLEELFTAAHHRRIEAMRGLLQRHELPIIIGWSFFPLAPTDLICYVSGVLRLSVVTCLVGVTIGEGAICGIYIFLGDQILRWLALK